MIYKEFSTDRKEYLKTIMTRFNKMNTIKETIKKNGTDKAIAIMSATHGSENEMISILFGRNQTIHIANAASLLTICFNALQQSNADVVLIMKYIHEILDVVGPLIRLALTEPNSIATLNILQRNRKVLEKISRCDNEDAKNAAQKVLSDYGDLI